MHYICQHFQELLLGTSLFKSVIIGNSAILINKHNLLQQKTGITIYETLVNIVVKLYC